MQLNNRINTVLSETSNQFIIAAEFCDHPHTARCVTTTCKLLVGTLVLKLGVSGTYTGQQGKVGAPPLQKEKRSKKNHVKGLNGMKLGKHNRQSTWNPPTTHCCCCMQRSDALRTYIRFSLLTQSIFCLFVFPSLYPSHSVRNSTHGWLGGAQSSIQVDTTG